ncbi:MAG: hypothetical protein JW993_01420 [Sedimentisphaerales bacterium]|nr:hypothetical protein [Sedimentisphaerales bacterium]
MAFRDSSLFQSELRHWLERWQERVRRWNLRGWINDHPGWIIGVACFSALLLCFVLIRVFTPRPSTALPQSKSAWFYDINTGRLFTGSPKQAGPITAPSGPSSDGGPAGYRAHVYSYVLDPNESELFVGFLERPNRGGKATRAVYDMRDFEAWASQRQIKRADDEQWVEASSPEGEAILQELLSPNEKGQTPLYQMPRP